VASGRFDVAVVGAGIVGLATALEALRRSPRSRILVVEKEKRVAAHQTSHNSGVIHSGLYYKPGSLKAKTCVEGARAMAAFCQEHRLPYLKCGKVVVAIDQVELPHLEELYRRGKENGVEGLEMIGPERLRQLEPHASGIRALHVPGTAITDFSEVARKFADIFVSLGGELRTSAGVQQILRRDGETVLCTTAGDFSASKVINCAGLHADRLCRMAGTDSGVIIAPFRGEYYELLPDRQYLVRGLIYPVPDPAFPFLGVHFTRKVHGGVEAGPNAVLALKREGYKKTDIGLADALGTLTYPGFWRMAGKYWRSGLGEYYRSLNKNAFVRALQRLVPEVRSEDLQPGGAGVRAQALDARGSLLDDFAIRVSDGLVNVCNVPSPAATASIVVARQIIDLAGLKL
jgi:(S)-2-hydroxyglutarate dehydrogenase